MSKFTRASLVFLLRKESLKLRDRLPGLRRLNALRLELEIAPVRGDRKARVRRLPGDLQRVLGDARELQLRVSLLRGSVRCGRQLFVAVLRLGEGRADLRESVRRLGLERRAE